MKKTLLSVILMAMGIATIQAEVINENFSNWSDNSYAGINNYTDAAGGQWESNNALVNSTNGCNGSSMRFNDDSGNDEYMQYQGIDGNGKDGGIGTISFNYRHWDGDGSTVEFQVQYSLNNGVNWINVGASVSVSSTICAAFSQDVEITDDNVWIQVISIEDGERLLMDDFSVTNFENPLPVTFTGFSAKPMEANSVMLNWATASEFNNDYFSVEHSTNGRDFDEIDYVIGAGTTTEAQAYSFTHKEATKGMNYYRLRQVDYDGEFAFSGVEVVSIEAAGTISVRPTIARNFVTLDFGTVAGQNVMVEIVNLSGQVVKSTIVGAGTTNEEIAVADLQAGYYFIRANNGNEIQTLKFVKQ